MSEINGEDRSEANHQSIRFICQIRSLTATLSDIAIPWIVGILLACCPAIPIGQELQFGGFWWPLVQGAGVIGGDVYNYFLPLKTHYAQGLAANTIYLWNPDIGHGVPVVGESQTGVFYPLNLLYYRFLTLNAAFNASLLTHYVLCFVFMYWLARELCFTRLASLFSSLVFTYGWFVPRACLEWAIVTGCWLPLAALCVLRWLRTGQARWLLALAGVLAVQLLAGHFQLAFVTILTLMFLAAFAPTPAPLLKAKLGRRAAVPMAVCLAFAFAAFQILPTWQLKKLSQRDEKTFAGSVVYGHIPAWYLLQLVAPFAVYPEAGRILSDAGAHTNKIEAHLYFGLLPLLMVAGLVISGRMPRRLWVWIGVTVLGLVLAIGWPIPYLNNLPGFGFFRYPGRYGLMAQLGFAVLAGAASSLFLRRSSIVQVFAISVIFAATMLDFKWVQQQDWYLSIVAPPPIETVDHSEVFAIVRQDPNARVWAMDANTLALSGRACVPPYLGMGPAEYYRIYDQQMPDLSHGDTGADPAETLAMLQKLGITHLLTESPLPADWPVTILWQGRDEFLARKGYPNLILYRFDAAWGRAYFIAPNSVPKPVTIRELHPHRVEIDCETDVPCQLVVTDLNYPGWNVELDGRLATPEDDPLFRIVALEPGRHHVVWTYTPSEFHIGLFISAAMLVICAASTWAARRCLQKGASGRARALR